jgi:lipoprotein-anchoring transpeptidase ErfK/SrfK
MRGLVRSFIVLFAIYGTAAWAQSSVQVHAALPEAVEPSIEQQPSEPVQEQGSQQPQGQSTEQANEPKSVEPKSVEPKSAPASEQKPQEKADQRHEQPVEHASEEAPKLDLSKYVPGTIVVETSERKLHLVLENGEVITYPVGVGKRGKSWAGTGAIAGKFLRPPWSPPKALRREKPWLPQYIPGGVPSNPMGAAAMTLSVDQYAIHGTNDPGSIGGFVSFGCIRMHNRDILDLYKRVHVGTRVVVLR